MKKRIIAVLLACTMLVSNGCSAVSSTDENGKAPVDAPEIEDQSGKPDVNTPGQEAPKEDTPQAAAEEKDDEEELKKEGGSPWIDSDLKQNIFSVFLKNRFIMTVFPRKLFWEEWVLSSVTR